jgi:hypothetical protein
MIALLPPSNITNLLHTVSSIWISRVQDAIFLLLIFEVAPPSPEKREQTMRDMRRVLRTDVSVWRRLKWQLRRCFFILRVLFSRSLDTVFFSFEWIRDETKLWCFWLSKVKDVHSNFCCCCCSFFFVIFKPIELACGTAGGPTSPPSRRVRNLEVLDLVPHPDNT